MVKKNDGFTLLEVLVGLVLLAISILAIAAMQFTAIRSNHFSGSLTQAAILAEDKMEELKNIPYANVNTGSDSVTIAGISFARQYNVVEDAGNFAKTITVTVQWTDKGNHSISVSTIRSK